MKKTKTVSLVLAAAFAAIIIMMAFLPFIGYIPLGVINVTIIHIPVIIGSIVLGPKYGAALGFVFGMTSLIHNIISPLATSFVFTPFYSVGGVGGNFWSLVICFVPRILVGILPYFVYIGIMKLSKKQTISLAVAGVLGSLTNTVLVMNMIYVFFGEEYAKASNHAMSVLYTVILGIIATNGIPEAIGAAILTAAIGKILLHVMRQNR